MICRPLLWIWNHKYLIGYPHPVSMSTTQSISWPWHPSPFSNTLDCGTSLCQCECIQKPGVFFKCYQPKRWILSEICTHCQFCLQSLDSKMFLFMPKFNLSWLHCLVLMILMPVLEFVGCKRVAHQDTRGGGLQLGLYRLGHVWYIIITPHKVPIVDYW